MTTFKKTPLVMYDLVWIVGGKVKEVLVENKPKYVCNLRANMAKKTTHKTGLLQPRRVENRPKGGWQ